GAFEGNRQEGNRRGRNAQKEAPVSHAVNRLEPGKQDQTQDYSRGGIGEGTSGQFPLSRQMINDNSEDKLEDDRIGIETKGESCRRPKPPGNRKEHQDNRCQRRWSPDAQFQDQGKNTIEEHFVIQGPSQEQEGLYCAAFLAVGHKKERLHKIDEI